ncbi:hypothetical protein V6N13_127681 [Hibiscus sabdariffa]
MHKASPKSSGIERSDASRQVPEASYLLECLDASWIKTKSLVAIRDRLSNMPEGLVSRGSLHIRLYKEALRGRALPTTILEK